MKLEFQQHLLERHARIFSGSRFRYFECGGGWLKIIDKMATELQAHIDHSGCEQVIANQFKEKFGEARFYFTGGDDHCHSIGNKLTAQSLLTCDLCGEAGSLGESGGWLRVRCSAHQSTNASDFEQK